MSNEQRARATAGLVLFISLSFLGSWFVAVTLRLFEVTVAPAAIGTRLFTTSLLYVVTMGWQPVVAMYVVRRWIDPRDGLDLGLRASRWGYGLIGAGSALGFATVATLVAWAAAALGIVSPSALYGDPEIELASREVSSSGEVVLVLAFIGTIALVWVQAFAEEAGWRGYFLPRAMERLGRWRGLILHGALWGLWYAPVLFFARYVPMNPSGSLGRTLGFVVTCVLLGILLGWLRLASQSIVPVIIANSTLTLAAGLPYVIHGVDAGIRSAAFQPVGWAVLLVAIASLLLSRWKSAVQTPARLAIEEQGALFVRIKTAFEHPKPGSQNLH